MWLHGTIDQMWRRVRIITLITHSINSFLIRNVERNNTPININTFSKPHRTELRITHFMSTTFNITGTEDNPSTLNPCNDSWPKNKGKTISMISRLCIQKIITIALKQRENISIDPCNFNQHPILTLQFIRDQLISRLKIEVYKEIQILRGWRGVYLSREAVFSIKPSMSIIGHRIG